MHTEDNKKEFQLLDAWYVLLKRRWVVYLSLAGALVTVGVGSFLVEPTYQATTQILIERDSAGLNPFTELFSVDASYDEFYQTQYSILRSRRVARMVVDELSLVDHAEFARTSSGILGSVTGLFSTSETPTEEEKLLRVTEAFLDRLQVDPVRNSRLVNIRFRSHDPELAAAAADAVALSYMQFTSRSRSDANDVANMALAQETRSLQEQIIRQERALQDYVREYNLIFVGEQRNLVEETAERLSEEYTEARIARIELESAFESLKNAPPEAMEQVSESPVVRSLKETLAELDQEYRRMEQQYKPGWPAMQQLGRSRDEARRQLDEEVSQVASAVVAVARERLDEARKRETNLGSALASQTKKAHATEEAMRQYTSLKADLDTRKSNLDDLLRRQSETDIAVGLESAEGTSIRVVDHAEVPDEPWRPNKKLNLAVGGILGLMLGVGLAFGFEHADNSIKNVGDIDRLLELPCLAFVPITSGDVQGPRALDTAESKVTKSVDFITHNQPRSGVAENFKVLRTSVLLSATGPGFRSLMVTSCRPSEGKSFTSINLAIALTHAGKRVLLLDADLRRPRLHRAFGYPNRVGMSTYLSAQSDLRGSVLETAIPNLHLMTSGPIPPNPSELIESDNFDSMLTRLEESGDYDYLIFDTSPLLSVTDPVILARKVDGSVLVLQAGSTPKEAALRAVEKLHRAQARVVGTVLNYVDLNEQKYYNYYKHYYYYDYSSDKPQSRGSGRKKRAQAKG